MQRYPTIGFQPPGLAQAIHLVVRNRVAALHAQVSPLSECRPDGAAALIKAIPGLLAGKAHEFFVGFGQY